MQVYSLLAHPRFAGERQATFSAIDPGLDEQSRATLRLFRVRDVGFTRVHVLPLFAGRVVIPYLGASRAQAGLEMDGERRTWRFGEGSDEPSRLVLGRVYLDDGHIAYLDAGQKTDLAIDVKGSAGENGRLEARAKGRFKGEPITAIARIPELATQHEAPVRFEGEATVGKTRATAAGQLATDGTSLDLDLKLQGPTLAELGGVTGIVLPDSRMPEVTRRVRVGVEHDRDAPLAAAPSRAS